MNGVQHSFVKGILDCHIEFLAFMNLAGVVEPHQSAPEDETESGVLKAFSDPDCFVNLVVSPLAFQFQV